MKNKIKSLSFWLELSGIIVLILDSVSNLIGIQLYSNGIAEIITTICIILISFGVINKKDEKDTQEISKKELINEVNNNKQ